MMHSVEQMNLLLMYLSLIGIWIGLPSVHFYVHNDLRWKHFAIAIIFSAIIVVIAYISGNKYLFPDVTLTNSHKDTDTI